MRGLGAIIDESMGDARAHAGAFVERILENTRWHPDLAAASTQSSTDQIDLVAYGGAPEAARLGYMIGGATREAITSSLVSAFLGAVSRLRGRPMPGMSALTGDDVAILGVADGLARLAALGEMQDPTIATWFVDIVERAPVAPSWSRRMRILACDLLDGRGRLRAGIDVHDVSALGLEIVLRETWPGAFQAVAPPDPELRSVLMEALLVEPAPSIGDVELAAVWLAALGTLTRGAAVSLTASTGEVVRLLEATQSALKRWVWEEKTRRKQRMPVRWLIDDESHVQSFLWATLYPVFGADVRDEQYLQGFGLVQPRYDLAVVSLRLIIEVKMARAKGDFTKIEEQIAGDLGIYFSDTERFTSMIVYVYDDCDITYPELYDILGNALTQRDPRIQGVVIVRRPSMIPPRNRRQLLTDAATAPREGSSDG